jgi:hypothetical protein
MRTKGWNLILALLGTAGCLATEPGVAGVGDVFELTPHQSVRVDGTDWTIAFRGVTDDTRCPVDLACLAQGDARIQLDIFGTDADNPILLGAYPPNATWGDGRYQVEVVDLTPVPSVDRVIPPEDYRVRLVVQPAAP